MAQNKKYRAWHMPQIPGKRILFDVATPAEGKKIIEALGKYDLFLLDQGLREDYSNVNGIEVFEDGEWTDWEDYGDDI